MKCKCVAILISILIVNLKYYFEKKNQKNIMFDLIILSEQINMF